MFDLDRMPNTTASEDDALRTTYNEPAPTPSMADNAPMIDVAWRERLDEAIKKSGKSYRAVSLSAGMGKGYVYSVLKEGKDPSILNLSSICEQVGVSVFFILHGFDLSQDDIELLKAIRDDPESVRSVLHLVRSRTPS